MWSALVGGQRQLFREQYELALGRQGGIAAARAEFQQADQRTFGEKVSAQSREAFADPKKYLPSLPPPRGYCRSRSRHNPGKSATLSIR